jgi:hypothetical protein
MLTRILSLLFSDTLIGLPLTSADFVHSLAASDNFVSVEVLVANHYKSYYIVVFFQRFRLSLSLSLNSGGGGGGR